MSKPDDLTSITKAIMSDEEIVRIFNDGPMGIAKALRAVLNAFAQRAGVTGEYVKGWAKEYSNAGWSFYSTNVGDSIPATLYIHPPARPVRTEQERLVAALDFAASQDALGHTFISTGQVLRLLRGEE